MCHPHNAPTTLIGSTAEAVLARALSHLRSALQLAGQAIGEDNLSPWANTALSIHLAAAGISMHLSCEPVPSSAHPDCLRALQAAQAEMVQLAPGHQLPLDELTLIRTRLATALVQARSLQGEPAPITQS